MKSLLRIAVCLCFAAVVGRAQFKALVFSKTAGFRHDSIAAGVSMIQSLGGTNNFTVSATENSAQFNDTNLQQFACVVFLSTTGDVLNQTEQSAFERYIRAGGGYVGIHAASDTEYAWPWYGNLVGAYFKSHPSIQSATIKLNDFAHPSVEGLPKRWQRTDEWYSFNRNPRGSAHVLATLDENSYAPLDRMGFDHPISWCQDFEGGRAWYTGAGHTIESYAEPFFRRHVLGGILWAAGVRAGDAGATLESNFEKVILDPAPRYPMQLAVAPDGRVFYIEREGNVKIWRPDTRTNVLAARVPVYAGNEDGLLGITLDPQFPANGWVYLFFSPPGDQIQHVSRFEMDGDQLLLGSEKVILTIPTDRGTCCHSGGALEFGPDGNLYIGVGDNTNPFESEGFAPIDERPGRAFFDAQRTSANANDLRGKILRIRPQPDGGYSIPAGNLFAPGTPDTRPEIYVMGNRNPFRLAIDFETGWLYWGEVGPDSHVDSTLRGPRGHDEWNQARSAGNYGWPYFVGNNKPYRDYDFATLASGPAFDPVAPVNQSPGNTGPQNLPSARPAWIWYPYADSAEFPELGAGGRCAMAGPIYHFNEAIAPNHRQLPRYFDKTFFIFDWTRGFIKEVKIDDNGDVLKINPFLPSFIFNAPIDMKAGPDGAIYLVEYGETFSGGTPAPKVSRLDYVGPTKLQSAAAVDGTFLDEHEIKYNGPTKSFSVPLGSANQFFRVRAEVNRSIRSAVRNGNTLEISID